MSTPHIVDLYNRLHLKITGFWAIPHEYEYKDLFDNRQKILDLAFKENIEIYFMTTYGEGMGRNLTTIDITLNISP